MLSSFLILLGTWRVSDVRHTSWITRNSKNSLIIITRQKAEYAERKVGQRMNLSRSQRDVDDK